MKINEKAMNQKDLVHAIAEKCKKEFKEFDSFDLTINVMDKGKSALILVFDGVENELIWEEEIPL